MNSFVAKHRSEINGVLQCFDRIILRGHLPIAGVGYFATWLYSKQIALNMRELSDGWWNFKHAAPWFAETLKAHARALAEKAGRTYRHLSRPEPMEENARQLAQRDGITEGLVCVYGAMETCRTFRVQYGEHGPKVRPDHRVCLVIYFYWMDREFGLMHVKLQTWFPFTVQVYVNGHEWLARKLAARGITFEKHDNAFVELADVEKASECAAGVLAARLAQTARSPGRPGQSFTERLAGRTELLLGDRPGRVFYRRAVHGQEGAGLIASVSVPARRGLFWRGTGDDVFGTEVSRDIQGGSANALASTRAWCSGQALGQE